MLLDYSSTCDSVTFIKPVLQTNLVDRALLTVQTDKLADPGQKSLATQEFGHRLKHQLLDRHQEEQSSGFID